MNSPNNKRNKINNKCKYSYNEQKGTFVCSNNKESEMNDLVIERGKTGNRNSQEIIYREFKDRIYTLALYYTRN
jgi:hypothetical protein